MSSRAKRTALAGIVATVVVGALGVGLALALSQGHLKAESYTATGSAKPVAVANNLTVLGIEVQCGTGSGTTEIKAETTSVTVTPSYGSCISGERFATVAMNGCTYVFHIGEGAEDSWPVTVDLSCPKEKQVEVPIYNNEAHTELWCTLAIAGQSGLSGITALNETEPGDEVVEGTVEGVSATAKGTCTSGEDSKTSSAVLKLGASLAGLSGTEELYDGLKIE